VFSPFRPPAVPQIEYADLKTKPRKTRQRSPIGVNLATCSSSTNALAAKDFLGNY